MSGPVQREPSLHAADAWWDLAPTAGQRTAAPGATRRSGRRKAGRRSAVARVAGALLAVPRRVVGRSRANARFRRFAILVGSGLGILAATTFAVGVIMLNNVVIERSAELGELDSRRRELRTENALLAAEIAKLSAPPRVVKLARKRLDMVPSPEMAEFIYLDAANRPLTAERRRQLVRRALRRQRMARARRAAEAASARPGVTSGAAASDAAATAEAAEFASQAATP